MATIYWELVESTHCFKTTQYQSILIFFENIFVLNVFVIWFVTRQLLVGGGVLKPGSICSRFLKYVLNKV
jgi:hypothetical protein